jgi:hypothetical protein
MCNFIKTDGNQCKLAPKKDLCHRHINSAPVAQPEPVAEEFITKIRSLSFEATTAEPTAEPTAEEATTAEPVAEEATTAEPVADETPVVKEVSAMKRATLIINAAPGSGFSQDASDELKKLTFNADKIKEACDALFERYYNGIEKSDDPNDFEDEPMVGAELDALENKLNTIANFAKGRNISIDSETQTIIDRVSDQATAMITAKRNDIKELIQLYDPNLRFISARKKDVSVQKAYSFLRLTAGFHTHFYAFEQPSDVEMVAKYLKRDLPKFCKIATFLREPVEQKKEEPELIEAQAKIVAEDIASPMSPNTTTAATSPIVEQTKSASIKKLFDDRECIFNHKGAEAHYWVEKCALSKADIYPILKNPNGSYWWDTKGYRVINVVHRQGKYLTRRYVYFENMVDMFAFVKYFHGKASSMGVGSFECHEVFIGKDPTIKMFFDIEAVIPVESYESMLKWMNGDDTDMANMVSEDIINAMKNALEEFDGKFEGCESRIDYAIVSRSRKVPDGMKLSYHVITNVAMLVSECKALAKVIKDNYLSCLNVERPDGYKDMLCAKNTLDTNPYRKNGSLSLSLEVPRMATPSLWFSHLRRTPCIPGTYTLSIPINARTIMTSLTISRPSSTSRTKRHSRSQALNSSRRRSPSSTASAYRRMIPPLWICMLTRPVATTYGSLVPRQATALSVIARTTTLTHCC